MSPTSISGTDGDIAFPIGVHDEDGRARHLPSNPQANPLICAWSAEREVERAGGRAGDARGGGDANAEGGAIGDGFVGSEREGRVGWRRVSHGDASDLMRDWEETRTDARHCKE